MNFNNHPLLLIPIDKFKTLSDLQIQELAKFALSLDLIDKYKLVCYITDLYFELIDDNQTFYTLIKYWPEYSTLISYLSICVKEKNEKQTLPLPNNDTNTLLNYYAANLAYSTNYVPYYNETEKTLYYLKLYNNIYNKILRKQKLNLINQNYD